MEVNRRTQEERRATTRAALVAAGRDLFATRGYGDVGTEEIVRKAGVTRGALYHHFADKTELFVAVFEVVEGELADRLVAALATMGDAGPMAIMRRSADAWLEACLEPAVQQVVLIDGPGVLGYERWRAITTQGGFGLVTGLLQAAVDQGLIRPQPLDPLAHILVGALDEAALYVARAEDPAAARVDAMAVLDQLLDGLTTG
jgi:AcrR family transcriptional regulator